MAPRKRPAQIQSTRLEGTRVSKKIRTEESASPPPPVEKEAETDSDPIIESDTASQSGEDDGASWPSAESADEEIDRSQQSPSVEANSTPVNGSRQSDVSRKNDKQIPGSGSSTSRESHAKQKALAQERKNAKPNADSIARSKKLWEQLRRKSHVELKQRKKLVAELFEIVTGRVGEFVSKHDTVRVVQTAIKYANLEQRKMIARELKGRYVELAKGHYSRFLIGKILVHGDEEIRDLVVPEFYGQVRRLINHPEASWILDDVYRGVASREQKALMLREWYGAEFALFKKQDNGKSGVTVSAELKPLLEANPEKRTPVMRALHDLINQLVQKKTVGFTMLHDAMLQYYLNVPSDGGEATEFLDLIKDDEDGNLLKNLAFTASGSQLVCLALARGTAKDRKQILRVYKGLIPMLASDPHGHRIILTAYEVVDDTVLVSKLIVSELTGASDGNKSTSASSEAVSQHDEALLLAVNDLNARTTLLYPFVGTSRAILSDSDVKFLKEIVQIRQTTSKKDPEVRRKELITALTPPLLDFSARKAADLATNSFGCQFLGEVLLSGIVSESEQRQPGLNAIVALLDSSTAATSSNGNVNTATDSNNDISSAALGIPLLESPSFGRLLKSLVSGGKFSPQTKSIIPASPPLNFHNLFFDYLAARPEGLDEALADWATGPNSFTVVGLLEVGEEEFGRGKEVKMALGRKRKRLEKAASASASASTSASTAGHTEKKDRKKVKGADGKASRGEERAGAGVGGGGDGGNVGARLLLSKI